MGGEGGVRPRILVWGLHGSDVGGICSPHSQWLSGREVSRYQVTVAVTSPAPVVDVSQFVWTRVCQGWFYGLGRPLLIDTLECAFGLTNFGMPVDTS